MTVGIANLGDLTSIRTGKLDANASSEDGEYPFFTCAREPLRISSYSYDCECVLVAGNGDLNAKYYQGKFDAYQRTYIVEARPESQDQLHLRYVYYFLENYLVTLREQSIGGIIKYIKLGNLTGAKIPLPPLDEQKRIAGILDAADALRAKRRESLAQLDTLLQSTFLDMFGDPVTNPMEWEQCVVGDVVHSAKDGPHVSPRYSQSGIPFLSTRHIKPGEVIWEDLRYIDQDEANRQWKKCKPEFGDILFTKGGTTGIAARVTSYEPFAVWVHVALLKLVVEKVHPIWMEAMLNSAYCYTQSQRYTHGIANRDLGLRRMVKIRMYVPPLAEQRRYATIVESIEQQKASQRAHLADLETLFASLQYRAFREDL